MKISKYLHSCLLVEDQNLTMLFDPGIYTYEAKVLDSDKLPRLDYILITHEHPDHFHLPFVKELLAKFPNVKIITNPTLTEHLSHQQINATNESNEMVRLDHAPHEKLWDKEPPDHVVIHVFNKLTHAGDSLHFDKSSEILALPVQAPWGSTMEAVTKALQLRPRIIIPIHDWHWKDEIRMAMYERLATFFLTHDIQFKGLETGKTVEV